MAAIETLLNNSDEHRAVQRSFFMVISSKGDVGRCPHIAIYVVSENIGCSNQKIFFERGKWM
jgi:hypothetical protein